MHSKGKGISRRCLPYRKAPPSWVHISAQDLTDQMVKLAKRGSSPSQIGVLLRDQYGIPQVKGVTGSKILRILKNSELTKMANSDSSSSSPESIDLHDITEKLNLLPQPGDTNPRRPTPFSHE